MTPFDPSPATAARARGRLTAYARWQLLDYAVPMGITSIAIGILLGMPLFLASSGGDVGPGVDITLLEQSAAGTLAFLAVLLATQRMVAGDRIAGYYRFYFSKPVHVVAFYAQKFAVYGIGVLLAGCVLWLLARLSGTHIDGLALLGYFAVAYVALGGLALLCSVLFRFDWTIVVALWLASSVLHVVAAFRGWPLWPLRVLPPVGELDIVRGALFAGQMPDTAALLWVVGYGVAAIALALAALTRRSLAA